MESCPAEHGSRFATGGIVCGVSLTTVNCPDCGDTVPVECGDVTGLTLNNMMAVARSQAAADCPGSAPLPHKAVRVGAAAAEPDRLPAQRTLEERVAALEELLASPLHAVTPESWTGDQVADFEDRLRDLYPGDEARRRQIRVLPSAPVLTPETARALLRECVTIVKPGEMLVVRAPDWWTPGQAGMYQEYVGAMAGDAFRVVVVMGGELAVAEPEHAPALDKVIERTDEGTP
jgi:hypothetical protein